MNRDKKNKREKEPVVVVEKRRPVLFFVEQEIARNVVECQQETLRVSCWH